MKLGLLAVSVLFFAGAIQGYSLDDAQAIRQVIEGQWDAFSRDDAEQAFSFASPEVRQLFSTAEGFLAMVRDGYPMVYRHETVHFQVPRIIGPFAFQWTFSTSPLL